MPRRLLALCAAIPLLLPAAAVAQRIEGLQTNQNYVEAVRANAALKIDDPKAVFSALLRSLPARVKVYPTESYYYFSFHHAGVAYAGNIRLDAQARREGKLYFAYFRAATQQHGDGEGHRAVLGAADGVDIKEVARLAWRVRHAGTSVVFALNDLSKVAPPAGALAKSENFIGPVFDESGLRFFLAFDQRRNDFLFILDETVTVTDDLSPTESADDLLLGRRTGFLFAVDKTHRARKVLVGVYGGNVALNNYFDGPFDQLPDTFIKGDALRAAIIRRQPELKGRIDRFGNLADGENRVLIAPYATYHEPEDLKRISACIRSRGLPVTEDCLVPAANGAPRSGDRK